VSGKQRSVWTQRYRPVALLLALALSVPWAALVAPPSAFADSVEAVIGGTGDQTKLPGGTGTATFYLQDNASPGGDISGCNASSSNPVTITVTSASPGVVTINSPGTFTLTACKVSNNNLNAGSIGYTVSQSAPPGARVTITGAGSGGLSGSLFNRGSFDVVIAGSSDTTPPTISATGVPSNWTNLNPVQVILNAVDTVALQSITYSLDGASPTTTSVSGTTASVDVSVSGNGTHTLSYCATDAANNSTCSTPATATVRIDTLKPTISGTATTNPNAAGWYKSDVTVAWTCTDPAFPAGTPGGTTGSGIVASGTGSCPPNSPITGEGRTLGAGPVTVKDNAGNTSDPASVTGIQIDRTAPTISAAIVKTDGTPRSPDWGTNWYKGAAIVRFTCTDPTLAGGAQGSGVASCPADNVLNTDGNNLGASGTATDLAGNTSQLAGVSGINTDGTPPQSQAALACTSQNGWCRGQTATVTLTATDSPPTSLPTITTSGVKEIKFSTNGGQAFQTYNNPIIVPLSGTGKASVQFYAVDNVGNTEPTNSVEIKYDNIAPTITHQVSPSPNLAGWNNANTTVQFTAVDDAGGSGVDSASLAPQGATATSQTLPDGRTQYTWTGATISSDTPQGGTTVTGQASDLAGNSETDPVVVKVDKTPPTITGAATTPAINNWYNSAVTIKFTCNDALSGIASCTGWSGTPLTEVGETLYTEGRNQSKTGTAIDFAGNSTAFPVTGINIDKTAPLILLSGIANGSLYPLGAVPAASCTAADPALADSSAGSGVVGTCGVTAVPAAGNTSTNGVGKFDFTATATDLAGNPATLKGSYTVVYQWGGFLQPINDTAHQIGTSASDTTISVFKAGSTVPAKFQLRKADGTVVQASTAPKWLTPAKGSATTSPVDESVYSLAVTTGGEYRWDSTAQQYIYNWGTAKNNAGNYWRIGVQLDDGQTYWVNIGLR
jgi:hypothetical protein